MLLMWEWNDRELSRMTPKLLTWGEGETEDPSIEKEILLALDRVDLVPIRRTSVLSLLSFKKLEVNQDLISDKHEVREGGGRVTDGFPER